MNELPDRLRETAIEFLRHAASGEVDAAFALVAPDFRHHNPFFASDAASLQAGMRDNARRNPDKTFEVQRAIAEGNLVAVHSRIGMPSSGATIAVVHIFRFADGRIAELWDVGQPQPETMPNAAGMF